MVLFAPDGIDICIWPDGTWCFPFEVEEKVMFGSSDDYTEIKIPLMSEDEIEERVLTGSFWPTNVKESALTVILMLSDHDKLIFMNTPKEKAVVRCHDSLGRRVRNDFGLWAGNCDLLESAIGDKNGHADDASAVIIEMAWELLNPDKVKNGN